jgi:D-alanyl-D-alanine carboxypeptidase (penicillin-binding protein 5/6)
MLFRISKPVIFRLRLLLLAAVTAQFLFISTIVSAHEYRHSRDRWDGAYHNAYFALNGSTIKPFLAGTYPEPRSHYCILIDAETGHVLYARNPDTRRPPASLTKIMAAILLLEHGRLSDVVVAPPEVVGQPETSLHLRPGERISLEDLLYAMLLRSANDTPIAGAAYLAGSTPAFVAMMNEKAAAIGCTNTHFVTPNGLYNPDHYSTASDLAKMARYAILTLPEFDKIVDTTHRHITRSIDTHDCWVRSTFESFLKYYPGANGVKTGFISQAGHCFIGSATRNHWRLIAVSLDSDYCREDVMGMLSYGFAHFHPHVFSRRGTPEGDLNLPGVALPMPVVSGGDLTEFASSDPKAQIVGPYTVSVTALPQAQIQLPIKIGDPVGEITLLRGGKAVAVASALAEHAYSAPSAASVASFNIRSIAGALGRMPKALMIMIVCAILLIGFTASRYAGSTAKNYRRSRRWFSS